MIDATTTTQANFARDINGYNTFALYPSTVKYNTILSAGVAQTFTSPTDNPRYLAIFSIQPGGSIWFAYKTTATLPSGAVASTPSEQNPVAWIVASGSTISAITNDTTSEIGVKFYAID